MHVKIITRRRAAVGILSAIAAAAAGLIAMNAYATSHSASSAKAGAYTVGVTADLTGFAASTYGVIYDGFRLYVDQLNAGGGINGHKINLVVRDDQSDPSKVVSDIKFFNEQKTNAVFYSTVSSTIAGYKSAMGSMPTLYGNACYPPAPPPHPAKNFFCVGVSPRADGKGLVKFLFRQMPPAHVKLAMVMEDLPGCRVVHTRQIGPDVVKAGGKLVDTEIVPLTVTNMDSVARRIIAKGANAVIHYCLTTQIINLAQSLKKFGWKGFYESNSIVAGLKPAMLQVKSTEWDNEDWFSLPNAKVPAWQKIMSAAKTYHAKFPIVDLPWGWTNGIVLAQALTKCGFPCSQSRLLNVMNHLTVATPDYLQLAFTPLKWTPTDHTSPNHGYQLYGYDAKSNKIVPLIKHFIIIKEPGMTTQF